MDNVLSHSKVPYSKLLEDPKILLQVARTSRTQTLLRTKIRKEGPQYRVSIEWLNAPRMELLSSENFVLPEGNELDSARAELQKCLARMIAKVPWKGHVTGRDADSVTVNIGANVGINPGDELIVATLDEAKRHPLLNAVVDWRVSRTGRLIVESVDERIAFCKVAEEESSRQIARNQKVIEVLQKPVEISKPLKGRGNRMRDAGETYAASEHDSGTEPAEGSTLSATGEESIETLDKKPRLGKISAGLALGSYSRDYTTSTGTGFTGSSGLFGARLEGQLWVTGELFADLALTSA